MNDIGRKQNEPRQLHRLAAQRRLYSIAKRIFALQLLLGGPIAIAWAIAVLAKLELRGTAAVWGLLVSLSDLLWLTPWQKRLRERAALIQEAFDCDVLQMPWNDIKVGKPVEPEVIKEQADRYTKIEAKFPPLTNWYAPVVSELPLDVGRIICQRANCWWDSKQRRRYAAWVMVSVVVVTVLMIALGFIGGLTVEKLFLGIVMPLSPAIILALRQFTEQNESAKRLDRLKDHADALWSDLCDAGPCSTLAAKCRALQDELFENRKRSPLVFDWIFQLLRDGYDTQMKHGAAELAEEARRRLGITT